jgi:hypothetical protein
MCGIALFNTTEETHLVLGTFLTSIGFNWFSQRFFYNRISSSFSFTHYHRFFDVITLCKKVAKTGIRSVVFLLHFPKNSVITS